MVRRYERKRIQAGGAWISSTGLPPPHVAALWNRSGPTSQRGATVKLRELQAMIEGLLHVRRAGLESPVSSITQEHLQVAEFVEALRVNMGFSSLDRLPNGKSNRLQQTPFTPEEVNDVWAVELQAGVPMDPTERKTVRDNVVHYMKVAEQNMG